MDKTSQYWKDTSVEVTSLFPEKHNILFDQLIALSDFKHVLMLFLGFYSHSKVAGSSFLTLVLPLMKGRYLKPFPFCNCMAYLQSLH